MFDFLKYQVIGFLTPEEKQYNANLQAREDARHKYWGTREAAVKRVWYLEQLNEWDFFTIEKSWHYTRKRWSPEDLFDFQKYSYLSTEKLFCDSVYKIIYEELVNKLGKEKLFEFKIPYSVKRDKFDKNISEFRGWFEEGFTIQEIVDCIVKFKDFNYKEYKKSKTGVMRDHLIGNNMSFEEHEVNADYWNIEKRKKRFQEEFLDPLYKDYDEQMELSKEFKRNPLAKQLYEQNKILKKHLGIPDEEPRFDFQKKKK